MTSLGSDIQIKNPEDKKAKDLIIQTAKDFSGRRNKYIQDIFTLGLEVSETEDTTEALLKIYNRIGLNNREKAILDGTKLKSGKMIVMVGHFRFKPKSKILDGRDVDDETNDFFTVPLGLVLLAGDDVVYNRKYDSKGNPVPDTGERIVSGNTIGLFDYKTNTIYNPRFEDYYDTYLQNSSGSLSGGAPRRLMSNCFQNYMRSLYVIDPAKQYLTIRDHFIFEMDETDIQVMFDESAMRKIIKA